MSTLAVLAFIFLPSFIVAEQVFSIVNLCPQAITLYINGESQGLLSTSAATNTTLNDTWSGLIYTDANGGSASGKSTTRAGFYGPTNYYYIVKDAGINTGLSINPTVLSTNEFLANGYCGTDICDSTYCPSIYDSPPTSFPEPDTIPPSTPLFSCPGTNAGYTLTFCPEKTFSPASGTVNIHPNGAPKKCLDVQGAIYANGTAVQIYDCNDTSAQRWTLSSAGGKTSIVLAGTNFCLDDGTNPSSGTGMKIWQCFDDLPAQSWEFTNTNQLKLSASDQCLDLRNGVLTNGNEVQTWTCGTMNTNQMWATTSI